MAEELSMASEDLLRPARMEMEVTQQVGAGQGPGRRGPPLDSDSLGYHEVTVYTVDIEYTVE